LPCHSISSQRNRRASTMFHERINRSLASHRTTLACVSCVISFVACLAVSWVESRAYAGLPAARFAEHVGVKGDCCTPGLKTSCSSMYPFSCTTEGIACDSGEAVDNCGSPGCSDSDNRNDVCESQYFSTYYVTLAKCTVVPVVVSCEGGGAHCMYTTSTATAGFTGCGQCSTCEVTSGTACQ
jgi:hypothetical protein